MSLHSEAYQLCERIAQAINTAAPGLRAKVTVTLDGIRVRPHDIAIELRPPQRTDGAAGDSMK